MGLPEVWGGEALGTQSNRVMLLGTNLKHAKAYNFRIVLETIRRFGPISRADVARRTELTAQTISNITRELLDLGLIYEAERQRDGRGAPSILLTINPDGAYSIGLDLDRDHLTALLVDFAGQILHRIHHTLDGVLPPEEAMDLLARTVYALLDAAQLSPEKVWGIGVGIPGPLDVSADGHVTNVANPKAFPGWHRVPVVAILEKRLQMPVFLENNATAAAIGERWYGAGQHISTFFYVFFSEGLGGGLIINGQPYDGHTGNAGELGYCYLPPAYTSAEDLALFQKPHLGILFNVPRLYRRLHEAGYTAHSLEDLGQLFRDQNPILLDWLQLGLEHLAPVILAIEYLIDPEAIFFGGRLPQSLITYIIEWLEKRLAEMRIEEKPPARLLPGTAGIDAAALGLATLPMYINLAPAPHVLLKTNGEPNTTRRTTSPY